MFMGAGLFNALKAMSSGCQGPVSSKPGFVKGWASFGMGTSSLSRQRHSPSRPRTLSIRPWTIWRNVQNRPLTGSSNVSSHFGQAYFLLTGARDSSSARRAVRAAAISGLSSRVSVAIASSILTSRPFTFLFPKRSGNFWRMSSRIMASPSPSSALSHERAGRAGEIEHYCRQRVKPPAERVAHLLLFGKVLIKRGCRILVPCARVVSIERLPPLVPLILPVTSGAEGSAAEGAATNPALHLPCERERHRGAALVVSAVEPCCAPRAEVIDACAWSTLSASAARW